MAYSEITFSLPASAAPGSLVHMVTYIKNIADVPISFWANNWYDGITLDNLGYTIEPGETHSILNAFLMPDVDTVVGCQTYYYGTDGNYHEDTLKNWTIIASAVGWFPMFTALVTSSQLTPSVISAGWLPMLNALVSSSQLAFSVVSAGWFPMFTALVNSPQLSVPGGGGGGKPGPTPSWVLPAVIISSAALVAAIIVANPKDIQGKTKAAFSKVTGRK